MEDKGKIHLVSLFITEFSVCLLSFFCLVLLGFWGAFLVVVLLLGFLVFVFFTETKQLSFNTRKSLEVFGGFIGGFGFCLLFYIYKKFKLGKYSALLFNFY